MKNLEEIKKDNRVFDVEIYDSETEKYGLFLNDGYYFNNGNGVCYANTIEELNKCLDEVAEINVVNEWGAKIDYAVAVDFMDDDELREQLHIKLAPCTEQEFFDAYAKAYKEKYGEEWILSEPNPTI